MRRPSGHGSGPAPIAGWPPPLLTALACTVRVSGLFLVGALLVMIITSGGPGETQAAPRARLMLIPVAVLVAFATYLHALTGSWTAWYHAQSTGWVRQLTWPWDSFLNTIPAILPGAYADHPWWAAVFRGEMISMAVGVGVTIWCIVVSLRAKRPDGPEADVGRGQLGRGAGAGLLAVVLVLLGQSRHPALVPAVDHAGPLGHWRPRAAVARGLHRVLVGCCVRRSMVVLMLWWSWLFFTGHWAS